MIQTTINAYSSSSYLQSKTYLSIAAKERGEREREKEREEEEVEREGGRERTCLSWY